MDTIAVTIQGVKPDVLQSKGNRSWELKVIEGGEIVSQRVIIPLNVQGENYLGTVGITYSHVKGYLTVTVSSAPVLLYGTSLKRVQSVDVPKLIDKLNETVAPYLKVSLNGAKVFRYDSSTLYDLSAPAPTFIVYLDAITRSKVWQYKKVYYQNEYLQLRNNTRSCGFYDKHGKAIENEIERQMMVDLDTSDTSPLRWEVQNKGSKAIKPVTGSGVILDDLKTEQVQCLFINQRKNMFNKLFPFTSDTAQIMKVVDVYDYYYKLSPRSAMQKTVYHMALSEGIVTSPMVEGMMKVAGVSRQGISKAKQRLTELQSISIPNRELYHELKTAIHNDNEL